MADTQAAPGLTLAARLPPGTAVASGSFEMQLQGQAVPINVTVPAGATTMQPLLPIFQGLCDELVGRAAARMDKPVSCRAGCSACCRHPVPVAPSEARAIAALVAAMPAERRDTIAVRFAEAKRTLAAAGVDTSPIPFDDENTDRRLAVALAYLEARVFCPFVEAGSCSIYADRPLICREYLVTSPAANCATPSADTIDTVPMAAGLADALMASETLREGHGRLLLIDALDWAAANPAPPPGETGPAALMAVLQLAATLANA